MGRGVNIVRAGSALFLNYGHLHKTCHQCAHKLLTLDTKFVQFACTRNIVLASNSSQVLHVNSASRYSQFPSHHHIHKKPLQCSPSFRLFSSESTSASVSNEDEEEEGGTQVVLDTASDIDPYTLAENDLATFTSSIRKEIGQTVSELAGLAGYHFDGQGKSIRPMILMLMARACNVHRGLTEGVLLPAQRTVSLVSEMIHTASLLHDDVLDKSDTRRGKPSLQHLWGHKRAVVTGNYILARACMMLARLGNNDVVTAFAQILDDLITGEFMQMGSKEEEGERFNHYLRKTFYKTASLLANGCKSVTILGQCSDDIIEHAYLYGKNIGIAFQLVDDLLDFMSSDAICGKPTTADLRLGLATAPVLFAALQYPQLNAMIMRRFSKEGDVETALSLVKKSTGLTQTRYLARQHCKEAIRQLSQLRPSAERTALIFFSYNLLHRIK